MRYPSDMKGDIALATMNVSLPDPMKSWVEDQERQAAILALQAAITEGLANGAAEPFDMKNFLRQMHEAHGKA